MSNPQDVSQLLGRTAVDSEGDKLGTIEQIYLNDTTDAPEWVTVKTGMFGTKESFAPLYGSSVEGDTVRLAVTKKVVKGAPNIDNDGHTDEGEQRALYDYYAGELGWAQQGGPSYDEGMDTESARGGQGQREPQHDGESRDDLTDQPGVRGQDTSGPTTDDAMTRSEERLRVGTEQVHGGKARLRKYVVTENVTQTVPVSHEEVRLEREPITEANTGQARSGAEISEEEHEITLHAERPVVEKEAVPVERVRLGTETVTEQHEVDETLRKEQIDDPSVEGEQGSATDTPRHSV